MQYQPVSLNTIRAAIMWGGLPAPRLKQVWAFTADSIGSAWSTVHATFGCIEIQRMCFQDYTPRSEVKAWLRQKLSDCFARDIQVQVIETTLNGAEIVAMLSCSAEEPYSPLPIGFDATEPLFPLKTRSFINDL